ncbi:MAG: hypothetical protein ABII82_13160 [Verrucomicrobiota bacterium]
MNSTTHSRAIPATPWSFNQSLPSRAGLDADLLLLGPGAGHELPPVARTRAFFVVTGRITVSEESTHHMASADNLITVPGDRPLTVHNHGDIAAKILVLALPAPRVEWRLFIPGEPTAPTL